MYLCICRAVTERDIRQAAAAGARTVRDLSRQLGVATCCGKCACDARDLLRECRAERCCREVRAQAA